MYSDKNIVFYIKFLPLASIFVLMTCIMIIILNIQDKSLKLEVLKLRNSYIQNEKRFIKSQMKQVTDYINYVIEENKTKDMEYIKQKVLRRISKFNFGQAGSIYLLDNKAQIILHKNRKIIGENIFSNTLSDMKIIQNVYNIVKNKQKDFFNDNLISNLDKKKKLIYAQYFKPFSWVIIADEHTENIDNKLANEINQIKKKYNSENIFLIIVSTVFAIFVIIISIILSRKITKIIEVSNKKKEDINKQLAILVKEKTSNLRHNLGFTNKLINTVPIPIYVKDQYLKYIDCNQAYCDFVGKNKKEIIGKSANEVNNKKLAALNNEKDLEMMDDDVAYQNYKYLDYFSGEIKVYEFYKAKFLHKKEIDGILGVIFDITQTELLAKTLKQEVTDKTIQNLKQSKKLEEEQLKNVKFSSIGQLAAGITHEINTPLTYILGNFEMMEYDIDNLPKSDIQSRMKEDCKKINQGLKRIGNIIESMREMSQKSKEEKELVNIYHTLCTSLIMAYNRIKQISKIQLNGIEFDVDINKQEKSYFSVVQKQRLEQVWVIIINNALDELSKIDKYDERIFKISIEFNETKEEIIVKFKDNAGGIANEIIDDIFEPFVSTKEYGGIGIGLNVAKKIIDEQDGEIVAYNEDNGAVFEIRLKSCDKIDEK